MSKIFAPMLALSCAMLGLVTPEMGTEGTTVLVLSNTTLAAIVVGIWYRGQRPRLLPGACAPLSWACRCPDCGKVHVHIVHDVRRHKEEV